MDESSLESYCRIVIQIMGRSSLPLDKVLELVGERPKQLRAFNLLDGRRSLSEVAKKSKLDRGNLSRTAKRWVANGVAFWVGEGNEAKLLHVYPIPESARRIGSRRKRKAKGRRQ